MKALKNREISFEAARRTDQHEIVNARRRFDDDDLEFPGFPRVSSLRYGAQRRESGEHVLGFCQHMKSVPMREQGLCHGFQAFPIPLLRAITHRVD